MNRTGSENQHARHQQELDARKRNLPGIADRLHDLSKPALRAVAHYNGAMEPSQPGGELLHLWTLLTPLPGLLVGSTYAEGTLESALRGARQPGPVPAFGSANVPQGPAAIMRDGLPYWDSAEIMADRAANPLASAEGGL